MTTNVEIIQVCSKNLSVAYQEGGHPSKTAEFYTNWANQNEYDSQMIYRGPEIAAATTADYFSSSVRSEVRILDVAAGTGFVAQYLHDYGFKHVDALDPAEGMLEKARQKGGLYDNYMCCYLDNNKLPTLADTYDCAVTSGGMGEGHIPYDGLDQLIRVVKPGGLVIIVMREAYLEASQYKNLLEPHMADLEERGQWQLISRTIVPEYCFDMTGVLYIYKVTSGNTSSTLSTSSITCDIASLNMNDYVDSAGESNVDSAGESNGEFS